MAGSETHSKREWNVRRGAIEVIVRVPSDADGNDHALAEDAASAARAVLRGGGGEVPFDARFSADPADRS